MAPAATVVCDGGVFEGTGGNDTLRGSNFSDTIYGGGGLDMIDGDLPRRDRGRLRYGQDLRGAGGDTAIVDDADLSRQSFEDFVRLSSCEEVRVQNP